MIDLIVSKVIEKTLSELILSKISSFLLFFLLESASFRKNDTATIFWKRKDVNKNFAKSKGKNMIRIKSYVPSRNFLSVFRKFLKQRFSRNNYRHCYHEFIKRFNIEGAEVFWEITVLARFAKLQGKTSIA